MYVYCKTIESNVLLKLNVLSIGYQRLIATTMVAHGGIAILLYWGFIIAVCFLVSMQLIIMKMKNQRLLVGL